jgi:hypothetical protein
MFPWPPLLQVLLFSKLGTFDKNDITYSLFVDSWQMMCGVFEPPSPRNTQKHDET